MAHKSIYISIGKETLLIAGEYTPRIPGRSLDTEGTPESFELEKAFHEGHDVTKLLDDLDTLNPDLWRVLDEKIMDHINNE